MDAWRRLFQEDLALEVLCRLGSEDKRCLRLASRDSRAAVNRSVAELLGGGTAADAAALPRLRLHMRFPRLPRLVLGQRDDPPPDSHPRSFSRLAEPPELRFVTQREKEEGPVPGDAPAVTSIDAFAQQTLSQLPRLVALVLSSCTGLPAAHAAKALAKHCPQLQELSLPRGGWPRHLISSLLPHPCPT
jgi:hypothetical protein